MEAKKKSKQQGKVILFPGTVERMFDEARNLAENYHYHEANELFEKALELSDGDEISLSVFAYSLYETKNFGRAKEICEDLFAIGPSMYFELMELYLTICMQLREFKQVEKIIESLFDEDVIPTEQVEKFQRLLKLNAEIAENQNTHLLHVEIEEERCRSTRENKETRRKRKKSSTCKHLTNGGVCRALPRPACPSSNSNSSTVRLLG